MTDEREQNGEGKGGLFSTESSLFLCLYIIGCYTLNSSGYSLNSLPMHMQCELILGELCSAKRKNDAELR
jgi:hypothetical protein